MTHTELLLDLFEPGMTPIHRAGVGGLALSLRALEEAGESVDGLVWEVADTSVVLRFAENDAEALVRLVERCMWCDESGLITFRAFEALPTYRQEMRAQLNEALLGTLLQHNKVLRPDGAKKKKRVVSVEEGQEVLFDGKELTDFVHRYGARDLVDQKGRLVRKPIKVKGWAVPGGVQRHKSATTALSEPPHRYLALLFAVVGVVPFRVRAPRRGSKLGYVLVVPDVEDLKSFVRARRRLVKSAKSLTVTGPGDAALRFFAELEAERTGEKLRVRGCHAIGMGAVPWEKQQKTRTEILRRDPPDENTLARFEIVDRCMPVRLVPQKNGGGFYAGSAWRELVVENLARNAPLWAGLHAALADKGLRERLLVFERKEIKAMVKEMKAKELFGSEAEQRFVEACHAALKSRFGKLNARVVHEGLDRRAVFRREVEEIRVTLGRCKNAETFRSAVVDLWSRGGRNPVLVDHWRQMIGFLREESWALGRDLALLALASYPGKEADDSHEDGEKTSSTAAA